MMGTESICGWNEDTKAKRDTYIKAVMGMDDGAFGDMIDKSKV
jgi:hypothetical protein